MNKNIGIAVAAVLMGLAGNAVAADFSELGGMTASRLSAAVATEGIPVPVASKIRGQAGEAATLDKLASDNGISGTPYQVLAGLFEKGVPPTENDMWGYHSGRTVMAGSEKFTGALLFGCGDTIVSEGGPLFGSARVVFTKSFGTANTPADRFDNGDPSRFFFYDVHEFTGSMRSMEALMYPNGVAMGIGSHDIKITLKITYKLFEGNIFERIEKIQEDGSYKDVSYSYYFKRIWNRGLLAK